MKRILITGALLFGTALGAQARIAETYYDMIRPNGHPRSYAVYQAALNACYRQTGASRLRADTPAFKQCMLGRNYKWTSARIVRGPSPGGSSDFDFPSPSPDLPPVAPAPDTPYVAPTAPTPDNPNCGGGLC